MRFARIDRAACRLAARISVCLGLTAALAGSAAAAGPWTPRDNTWTAEIRLSRLSTSSRYDNDGDKIDYSGSVRYREYVARLAAEYGVSDRWSLALGLPIQFMSLDHASSPFDPFNNGFGDAFVGVRFGALSGDRAAVSVQLESVLPTGYNAFGKAIPAHGFGKKRMGGRVLAGYTLAPTPVYAQAEVGYHTSNDPVAPEIVGSAEVGAWATPRVLVYADAEWSKNGDDQKLYEDFTRAGINVEYKVKNAFHVGVGAASELMGKNHAAGTSIRLGLAWKSQTALDPYHGRMSRPDGHAPEPKTPVAPPAVPVPEAPAPAPAESDTTKSGG